MSSVPNMKLMTREYIGMLLMKMYPLRVLNMKTLNRKAYLGCSCHTPN